LRKLLETKKPTTRKDGEVLKVQISFFDGVFRARCKYDERLVLKNAGFRWDNELRAWYTPDYGVAARFDAYLDKTAKAELERIRICIKPWTGGLSVPVGEELYKFQTTSAIFALERNRSYLALDPGLGKTPIAAVVAQTLSDYAFYDDVAIAYLCPPFLTRNTENEFATWSPRMRVKRYEISDPGGFGANVIIFPDSIISRDEVLRGIQTFAKVGKDENRHTVLFIDEAHRFKNDEAGRTQALFGKREKRGIAKLFDRCVYLSGTPMPNRPIELYPVLSNAAPQTIGYMNKFEYAVKYCAAYKNQWGWDFSGCSNLDELVKNVIGTFMIRFRKADVLKELPPKTESMVLLSDDMSPRLTKLSKDILQRLSPEDLMKGQIQVDLGKDVLHLSTYRRELGVLKAKAAAEYIKYLLDETEEAILVFAIHKEVIEILTKELDKFEPLVITGATRMELRHAYVSEFQNDKRRRLFIGNIQAAGTGLTLTKATRVVFAEFSWVPADNDQASDRAHRIGQKDNVFVEYLVYKNSVDKTVIETVLRKKKITERL
jgi:SWI/SNF-related matrix-associated actin-dependent regulator 1 of chromatin subfamily A